MKAALLAPPIDMFILEAPPHERAENRPARAVCASILHKS
jgi:hypothetical protein